MHSIGYLDCQKKRVDFSSDKLVAYATYLKKQVCNSSSLSINYIVATYMLVYGF